MGAFFVLVVSSHLSPSFISFLLKISSLLKACQLSSVLVQFSWACQQ